MSSHVRRTRPSPVPRLIFPLALSLGGLAGCRSYEPAPLELAAYRQSAELRLLEGEQLEPLQAFLDRLVAAGRTDVPDRFDPADGLSPAEGEVLALFHNPQLRLARLDAGLAAATAETAGAWSDPVFGFDAEEILSGDASSVAGFGLELTIPVSGRLSVERARAEAALDTELARVVAAEWAVRASVRRAWISWTVAMRQAELRQDLVRSVDRIAAIADRLEAAGELDRTEARVLRLELEIRQADAEAAEHETIASRIDLLALMGVPPGTDVALTPAFDRPAPPAPTDPLERIIARNPELAIRRAEHLVAEESLRLEIRRQYPDITIGAGYGSEGDDRLRLGISLPLPILDRNRQGIAEAAARRQRTRAAAETTFDRLAVDLAHAEARSDIARRQRERFEGRVMPSLAEQSGELNRLADLGEMDVLLLLDAVTRRTEAGIRTLELRRLEAIAQIDLTELLGPDEPLLRAMAIVGDHAGPADAAGAGDDATSPSEPTTPVAPHALRRDGDLR